MRSLSEHPFKGINGLPEDFFAKYSDKKIAGILLAFRNEEDEYLTATDIMPDTKPNFIRLRRMSKRELLNTYIYSSIVGEQRYVMKLKDKTLDNNTHSVFIQLFVKTGSDKPFLVKLIKKKIVVPEHFPYSSPNHEAEISPMLYYLNDILELGNSYFNFTQGGGKYGVGNVFDYYNKKYRRNV